jgi:hypothetical protein
MLVQHKIHGTGKWYTVDTARDLETAENAARNYMLNNGGSVRVLDKPDGQVVASVNTLFAKV